MTTPLLSRLCSQASTLDPSFAEWAYMEASAQKDTALLATLASRTDLPVSVDEALKANPLAPVRASWLARPGHAEATLEAMLADEKRITVLERIAATDGVSDELAARLVGLEHPGVSAKLLMNPSTSQPVKALAVGPALRRLRPSTRVSAVVTSTMAANPADADVMLTAMLVKPERLIYFSSSISPVLGFASDSIQVAVVAAISTQVMLAAADASSQTRSIPYRTTSTWNEFSRAALSPAGLQELCRWYDKIMEVAASNSIRLNKPAPAHPLLTTALSTDLRELAPLIEAVITESLPSGVDIASLAAALARNPLLDAVEFACCIQRLGASSAVPPATRVVLVLSRVNDYDTMVECLARNPELIRSRASAQALQLYPGLLKAVVDKVVSLRDVDPSAYERATRMFAHDESLDDDTVMAMPWAALTANWSLRPHSAATITRILATHLLTESSRAVFTSLQERYTGTFSELLTVCSAAPEA